jgi:hypothetical protein
LISFTSFPAVLTTPGARTTKGDFVIDLSVVAKLRRSEAIEMSKEVGIRPFYLLPLAYKERRDVEKLLEKAALLFPSDSDRRGEYIRRHARAL